ncbi:MAG TPA: hypothetical protein VEX36_12905 [Thermoleophilaceae bacterium]|nr:hypothetical protein [Thermoleophilaceae bacterium]
MYYYEAAAGLPDNAAGDNLIDTVANREKANHAIAVSFVRGKLWSQEGGPAANNMISQKNLTGAGALATTANMDRERAILFRLRAGNDSRGNPVYLRKWFHFCCGGGGFTVAGAHLEQTTSISPADRTAAVARINNIGDLGGLFNEWKLCAKSGRFATAGANWECHPYVEHHQLGDQWRSV